MNCFKKKSTSGATADERVQSLMVTAEERRVCGLRMIEWYREIKKAREEKGAANAA